MWSFDGRGVLGVFRRIALLLARPGIVATAILGVIASWNNFIFSLVIAGNSTRTLPVAIFNFVSYDSLNWGSLTAASSLITATRAAHGLPGPEAHRPRADPRRPKGIRPPAQESIRISL